MFQDIYIYDSGLFWAAGNWLGKAFKLMGFLEDVAWKCWRVYGLQVRGRVWRFGKENDEENIEGTGRARYLMDN